MKAINILSALLIFSLVLGCSKDDADTVSEPQESSEKQITSFQFLLSDNPFNINVVGNIDESNKTISFNVPDGAEITALFPIIQVSPNATYTPQGIQSFKEPVVYTITAEDGTSETYTVSAILSQRHILMAIYNANPNNTLGWDLESQDIGSWYGVTLNEDQKVSEIDFNSKDLEILPYEIGQLADLKYLSLSSNNLEELPSEIGQLTNLMSLILNFNELTDIPSEIGQLNNLTTLVLTVNNLELLPSELWQLTNLTSLGLGHNNLTEISSEIGQLSNLTWLKISFNNLIMLPAEIWSLTNLTSLSIGSNNLSQLPIEIVQLNDLTFLDISFNNFIELREEIGQLTNLEDLYLYDNQLTEIPSSIGQLTNLKYLWMSNNNFTTIPQVVCDLITNYEINVSIDAGVVCE